MIRGLGRVRAWVNRLADKTIDCADEMLLGVKAAPPGIPECLLQRDLGDLGWLLHNLAGQRAWELRGRRWSIGLVGSERTCELVRRRFFDEPVEPRQLGIVGIVGISGLARDWLDKGRDLVICEVSRNYRFRWVAPIQLAVPSWINQVLTIPDPVRTFVASKDRGSLRRRIARFEQAGFTYRFTRDRRDFDHFYYEMYRPFVTHRHGACASIARYPKQYEMFFVRGGLVQVLNRDRPVAGSIVHMNGDTCYDIEGGVLHANPELIQRGINIFIDWCAMQWGAGQGARLLNMGGTRPFTADGVFQFKRGWGARVTQRQRPYSLLSFTARAIRPALREWLNELGLIGELECGLAAVVFVEDVNQVAPSEVAVRTERACRNGLDHVLFLSPHRSLVVPSRPTICGTGISSIPVCAAGAGASRQASRATAGMGACEPKYYQRSGER